MRRSFWWLFLLLQGTAFVLGANQDVFEAADERRLQGDEEVIWDSRMPPPTDIATGGSDEHDKRQPGAELVEAALAELAPLASPGRGRRRRQSGFVGFAMRNLVKALPSFQMSAPPPKDAAETHPTISGPLLNAVTLLEQAAQMNNTDALYLLAEMNFFGNYSHPKDLPVSFNLYRRLADLNGNSSALYMMGLMHSTGVGRAVEPDQAKALLYYTFAAARGHTRAEMTVASRHHSGIGTPRSCEAAVKYYKRVADKAIAWYRSGPPGGMAWVTEAYRIADEHGGVYGEGASVVSSGVNAMRQYPSTDVYAHIDDIIEYLDLMSQKQDYKASFNLGRIYYEGQRGLGRDFDLAKKYFFTVVKRYWKKNGQVQEPFRQGLDKIAGKAAGYIGRMYMRGEGVEQNFERAQYWFDRGISMADAQSQYCLGLMLLNGLGVAENVSRAIELFKAAAEQDLASAQVQVGALYLDQGGPDGLRIANDYFEQAVRYGQIEAQYYLAEMIYHGVGREKACGQALVFYKSVAEKAEPLVSSWEEANVAVEDGDLELAFLDYLIAAEQGYEKAQNNVAYLLDEEQSALPLPNWLLHRAPRPELLTNPSLALIHWTRSSKQGNVDALVKMGDYYLSGIGTQLDLDKAVQCYHGASEYHQSAQALYNLGWMHENGIGLNQDYHLAKRYYDFALNANEEAYLPVTLSLFKLRAKSAWNTLTHGRINSIQDEPQNKKKWSMGEWMANFLQDDGLYYDYDDLYDDKIPGGDGEGYSEDVDDGFFESLLIVGLAIALVFLVYYRQQRQMAHQREEANAERRQQQLQQEQQQLQAQAHAGGQNIGPQGGGVPPAENGGLFPQPGNPAFADWAVGGVGH